MKLAAVVLLAVLPAAADTASRRPHELAPSAPVAPVLSFPESSAPAGCAPMKGLVLWPEMAASRPDLSSAVSLEYSYCLPCDIAVGTDAAGAVVYDWSRFEALLGGIAARRHQAVVRFRYAYPGEKLGGVKGATAVPAFIKARSDYRETFAKNPGGDGPTWYPDWSCRALEGFTLAFYGAFARRYDADPRIAFLQVGFGHWAEYHTFGTATRLGVNFPSLDFQRRFFRSLSANMKLTPWMVSIDSAARDAGYSPAVELWKEGVRFGLFDDSFMCATHEVASGDGDNELNWNAFGPCHWKSSPHGGEISYYRKSDQRRFLGPDGIYGMTWANAAEKYHMTFVIANDAPGGPYATKERFLQAQEACGYRLVVRSARPVDDGLLVEVENVGVAPFFFPATLACAGRKAEGTLQGIQPKETRVFTVPGAVLGARLEVVSPKFLGGANPMKPTSSCSRRKR